MPLDETGWAAVSPAIPRTSCTRPMPFTAARQDGLRAESTRHAARAGSTHEPRYRRAACDQSSTSTAPSTARPQRSCRVNTTLPASDMLIVTVLGSCVAACIRDRVAGIGGMNHFMLPDSGGTRQSVVCIDALWRLCNGSADQPAAQGGCPARKPGSQGVRRRQRIARLYDDAMSVNVMPNSYSIFCKRKTYGSWPRI